MDQIKCDLADIKAKLKFLMEKMEKQVSVIDQSIVSNGSNTSLTSPFQAVLGSVPFTESIITSGVAHNGGNVPIPNSGNNSYQMSSSTLPIGGSVPCFEVAYSIPTAPVPGSSQFQLPAVTFSSAMLGSNHLHQLSIHNDNYSNSIPLMEYNMLKFDGGEDVRSWIGKCERVFILENTPQNCKVQRATMALEGSAFIWHRVYTHQKFGISWQDYSQATIRRFDKSKYAIKGSFGKESRTPILSVCTQDMNTSSSVTCETGSSSKVEFHLCTHQEDEDKDILLTTQNEDTDGILPYMEIGAGFPIFIAPVHENMCLVKDLLKEDEDKSYPAEVLNSDVQPFGQHVLQQDKCFKELKASLEDIEEMNDNEGNESSVSFLTPGCNNKVASTSPSLGSSFSYNPESEIHNKEEEDQQFSLSPDQLQAMLSFH